MAVQLKGDLLPIKQTTKKEKPRPVTAGMKRFNAFSVLKQVNNVVGERCELQCTVKSLLCGRVFGIYKDECHRCAKSTFYNSRFVSRVLFWLNDAPRL